MWGDFLFWVRWILWSLLRVRMRVVSWRLLLRNLELKILSRISSGIGLVGLRSRGSIRLWIMIRRILWRLLILLLLIEGLMSRMEFWGGIQRRLDHLKMNRMRNRKRDFRRMIWCRSLNLRKDVREIWLFHRLMKVLWRSMCRKHPCRSNRILLLNSILLGIVLGLSNLLFRIDIFIIIIVEFSE